jgi:RNA polymerase sigma factor (sigma-70 family)
MPATLEAAPPAVRAPLGRRVSDEALVARVRQGDDRAFEQLFERYHPQLRSFCAHMLRDRDEGEDAVQQAFISALKDLRGSTKPVDFRPWIYQIARNRCLTTIRLRKQHAELGQVEERGFEYLGRSVGVRQDLRQLLDDLHRLPNPQREALVLSELGDLSGQEVAGVLGCAPAKVRALIFQARESLLADREARATDCLEVRERLASWTGAPDRLLGRHLKLCSGCSEYRAKVRAQRAALALVLPVAPSEAFAQTTSGEFLSRAPAAGGSRRRLRLGVPATLVLGLLALGVGLNSSASSEDRRQPAAPAPDSGTQTNGSATSTASPAPAKSGARTRKKAGGRARREEPARNRTSLPPAGTGSSGPSTRPTLRGSRQPRRRQGISRTGGGPGGGDGLSGPPLPPGGQDGPPAPRVDPPGSPPQGPVASPPPDPTTPPDPTVPPLCIPGSDVNPC